MDVREAAPSEAPGERGDVRAPLLRESEQASAKDDAADTDTMAVRGAAADAASPWDADAVGSAWADDNDDDAEGAETDGELEYPPMPLSHTRPRAMLRSSEILWIAGVVFVMVFLHVTSHLFIMRPYYLRTPSFTLRQLVYLLAPLQLLCAYMYLSYYRCVTQDAGGVPVGWAAPTQQRASRQRFCYKCQQPKPPRAHHCRVCKRCVLKYDHHCPWIGNCVGFGTYVPFLQFTTTVVITQIYHLTMITMRVYDAWNENYYMAVFLILNYLMGIPTLALVGFLTLYHYYLVCTNTTSVESWEKDRVGRQIRRGLIPYTAFPFDVGCWPNVTAVMGPHPWRWAWRRGSPGNGLVFAVVGDHDSQYAWPPADPRARRSRPRRLAPDDAAAFTYGDGQLNPALQPSHQRLPQPQATAQLRQRPPLAPAQPAPGDDGMYDSYSSDGDSVSDPDDYITGRGRVRRGSEGYEVRPPDYRRALWVDGGAAAFPPGTAPPPDASSDGHAARALHDTNGAVAEATK